MSLIDVYSDIYADTYGSVYGGGGEYNPTIPLPCNILSLADSDFGVSGFTWTAETSADAPAVSTTQAFSGSNSLTWESTATAGNPTQIHTGLYPCNPGAPYIASLWIYPAADADCYMGFEWCNSAGTLLSTQTSTDLTLAGGSWQPLTIAGGAPSGATQVRVWVQVAESNPGDVEYIDFAYLAQSMVQVLVDWFNPPYGDGNLAGQNFMDVSPFVRYDTGITIQSGRQDSISEIQPGSVSFTLQNDEGLFTDFNTDSPIIINGGTIAIQMRYQINEADENTNWWTRADGPLSEIDYQGDNTGNTNQAAISGSDVLAYLSRQDILNCWTVEQVLADGPSYTWLLNDAGNAVGSGGVAAESSGNNGPPLRLMVSGNRTGPSLAWQDSSGGIETLANSVSAGHPDGSEYWIPGEVQPTSQIRGLDSGNIGIYTVAVPNFGELGDYTTPNIPLPSVTVTPQRTAQSDPNLYLGNAGYYLQGQLPIPITPGVSGDSFAVELWYTQDVSVLTDQNDNYGPYIPISLGNSRTQSCLVAGIFLPSKFGAAYYSNPPAWQGANFSGSGVLDATWQSTTDITLDSVRRPHHLVLNFNYGYTTSSVAVWLDGEVVVQSQSLNDNEVFDMLTVGAAYGGYGGWCGNLSVVSVYPEALTQSQINLHCQLGQYGMWECPADDCIAQLATVASVPPFWNDVAAQHQGLSLTDYQDITGSNVLDNIQEYYEPTEGGLLFVTRTGQLSLHTRGWRMGYGAPDLLLPADSFDADMGLQIIDQDLINEQAVNTNTFSAGVSYVNSASQAQYGAYAVNGIGEPITYPLISWTRAFAQLGVDGYGLWGDPCLIDNCAWVANSKGEQWLLPGTLTIDLKTIEGDPSIGLARSDFFALEIDSMVAPDPSAIWPASFPNATGAVEWFIEGINETITMNAHTLALCCSPAMYQRAWKPADDTYGILGSTTRLGISAPDLSTPQADGKDVSHDAGPPYWVPTFAEGMNDPADEGHDFIGMNDIRAMLDNLQNAIKPPIAAVGTVSHQQSVPSGATSTPEIFWDTLYTDTAAGWGAIAGWPSWYCVTVPGWYEIDGQGVWSIAGPNGNAVQVWLVVAQAAAQAVAAGSGTPLTVGQYVCPVGETQRILSGSGDINGICCPATRMYLGLGDMVTLALEQDSGSTYETGFDYGGCELSLRFVGIGTEDDRCQVNTSLANGGTVTTPPKTTGGSTSFVNTETYSYYGSGAPSGTKNTIRDTNGIIYQGSTPNSYSRTGAQYAQVVFNVSAIRTALAGKTITGAYLTCENNATYPGQNGTLMFGYFVDTPGEATWVPSGNAANESDLGFSTFRQGETKTYAISLSIAEAILDDANGIFVGNDKKTTNTPQWDNQWVGGSGTWTLKFTYNDVT